MSDCIFCRIIAGELPADIVYKDEDIVAFRDINPIAPVHILVVPIRHISSLAEVDKSDTDILGRILFKISEIAKDHCPNNEYRVETNIGESWGQTVMHMHFHLLGGQKFD